MSDSRQHAPATARNAAPILAVLREILPTSGTVLEVASGTGEHAVHFASALPHLQWQPSDASPEALGSIAAWREAAGTPNLLPPLPLDAASAEWPVSAADAIVCINMIHISPWTATAGLIAGAARLLPTGEPLVLYGPFRRSDRPLEPSNAAFDADLRRRNPAWGLRLLEDVVDLGKVQGLAMKRVVEMPANNLTLVLRKS